MRLIHDHAAGKSLFRRIAPSRRIDQPIHLAAIQTIRKSFLTSAT